MKFRAVCHRDKLHKQIESRKATRMMCTHQQGCAEVFGHTAKVTHDNMQTRQKWTQYDSAKTAAIKGKLSKAICIHILSKVTIRDVQATQEGEGRTGRKEKMEVGVK